MSKRKLAPARSSRIAIIARRYPGWSWSTLAAVVAVLTFASPYVSSVAGLIETTSQAKAREDKIREELKSNVATIYAEVNKLRMEVEKRWASDTRSDAGTFLQLLENKVTTARNRVNDCNIMRGRKGPLSPLESSVCKQYDDDYSEALRRYQNQQSAATQTWRER